MQDDVNPEDIDTNSDYVAMVDQWSWDMQYMHSEADCDSNLTNPVNEIEQSYVDEPYIPPELLDPTLQSYDPAI